MAPNIRWVASFNPPNITLALVKIVILIALLVIMGSLGSALYYLLKDRERSPRTVKALTTRIGVSLGLFVLLIAAFASGLIKPHGLRPDPVSATTEQQPAPSP